MQLRPEQVDGFLQTNHGVLGAGWREVNSFDDLEDEDEEYEYEETEEYITLDLGAMDARYLQTEATLQLIGLDTGLPHLKIGNAVLQGEVTPLIGSEILLGLIRNHENPHNPSHPPVHATSHRITFRPIQLWHNSDPDSHIHQIQTQRKAPFESIPTSTTTHSIPGSTPQISTQASVSDVPETGEEARSMFLHRPAKNGPNRPEVFPGKQRDRIRAEKRAEKGKERERVEGEQQDQQIQVLSENRDQSIVEEAGDGEADNDDGDEGMVVDGDEERPVNRSVAGEEMVIDPALMDIDNINPNSVDPVVEMDQHLDQAYRMDQMDQIDHSFAPQASASPRPTPAPTAITSRVDHSMLVSVPVPVPVSTHQPTQGQAGSESRPIPSSSPSTPSGLTTPNHIPNPYPYPDPMFDSGPADNADIFTSTPGPGPSTPYPTSGAGSSTGTGAGDGDGMEVGLPSLDTQQDPGSDMFATGPRSLGRQYKGGRPRTRPLLEIHRADQLVSTNINYLPDNVRILVSPLALGLVPIQSPNSDVAPFVPQSLEFTKTAFKRWLNGTPNSGSGSRGGPIRAKPAATPTPSSTPTPRARTQSAAETETETETPGAGPSTVPGTGGGNRAGTVMGTPTATPTPTPKAQPSCRSVATELRRMDKPFLMTMGPDTPQPRSRSRSTTDTNTNTNTSTGTGTATATATAIPSQTHRNEGIVAGQGWDPDPPEDLEPEARMDLESLQDAEALDALRDAIQRSG